MNKKAFTLVELLAVIVIISLLSGIAVISYSSLINESGERNIDSYLDTMHVTAVNYYSKNTLPGNNGTARLILNNLVSDGLIQEINNPFDKSDKCLSNDSYIDVLREDKLIEDSKGNIINTMISLKYTVNLKCNHKTYHKVYEN